MRFYFELMYETLKSLQYSTAIISLRSAVINENGHYIFFVKARATTEYCDHFRV